MLDRAFQIARDKLQGFLGIAPCRTRLALHRVEKGVWNCPVVRQRLCFSATFKAPDTFFKGVLAGS